MYTQHTIIPHPSVYYSSCAIPVLEHNVNVLLDN